MLGLLGSFFFGNLDILLQMQIKLIKVTLLEFIKNLKLIS